MKSTILFPVFLAIISAIFGVLALLEAYPKELLWVLYWEYFLHSIGVSIALSMCLSSSLFIQMQYQWKSFAFSLLVIFLGIFSWAQAMNSNTLQTNKYRNEQSGLYFESPRPSMNIEFLLTDESKKNYEIAHPIYMWTDNENTMYLADMHKNFTAIRELTQDEQFIFLKTKQNNKKLNQKSIFEILVFSHSLLLANPTENKHIWLALFYILLILLFCSGFLINTILSSPTLKCAVAIHWFIIVFSLLYLSSMSNTALLLCCFFSLLMNASFIFYTIRKEKLRKVME